MLHCKKTKENPPKNPYYQRLGLPRISPLDIF